jgi:hypothetical protein
MSAKKATRNTQDNAAHGGCSGVTCSPSYYTFRNRDGQTFQLRGDLTMEDLVRMGYGDIRLVQPETPLKPREWRCDQPPNPISFTVLHEVNGEWRCWAVFKTRAGAERCAAKVTTRRTKILQENTKDHLREASGGSDCS